MIDDIKKNIESEIEILKEISINTRKLEFAGPSERKLLIGTIDALRGSMRIINNSIPSLVSEISLAKKLPMLPTNELLKKQKLERVNYQGGESELRAVVHVYDKDKLLKELDISEGYIKRLRRRQKKQGEKFEEFKAASGYMKLANRLFLKKASEIINKGYFKKLSKDLRKANIEILFHSYVAMIFMSTLISVIVSVFTAIFLFFFNVGISLPFISFFSGNYLLRAAQVFWIPFIVPLAVFIALYYYPTTEKQTISKKISQELPFAVIHMSAISGSGIQPSEIFRIIGLSKEYPYLRKEIRKVLNQINLYGYDLVTALNNAASSTSSDKLAELFFGLATTINSGGEFSEFFNKRAETLLIDYRIERQKFAKSAETLMDIYISVVIAAPMILMLFLILLTMGNFSIGLSIGQLTLLVIAAIALINIFFLLFIHLNQPSY